MHPHVISILRPVAVLSLILCLVWMFLEPGFEPALSILGAVAALTPLIITDKVSSSSVGNTSSLGHPSSGTSSPSPPIGIPDYNTSPSSDYSLNWLEDVIGNVAGGITVLLMIAGASIGFVGGLEEGALRAAFFAVIGAVVGAFAGGLSNYVLQLIVLLAIILWGTRYFWLVVGVIVAVGYFITGSL